MYYVSQIPAYHVCRSKQILRSDGLITRGLDILGTARMSLDSIPRRLRNLRACLLCSMIKTVDQFELDGCDNCESYLGMKGDEEKVSECTSSNFDGIIAAFQPDDSWVCKWQKINRKARGFYAISVSGSLPSHVVHELKTQNIRYKPNMRDMTRIN